MIWNTYDFTLQTLLLNIDHKTCFTQVCYVSDFADYTVYECMKHKTIMFCFSNEMLEYKKGHSIKIDHS